MSPSTLNILGLVISTLSALLMYYYPPRDTTQYSDAGEPQFNWVGQKVEGGEAKAQLQRRLSVASPAFLAIGFALQLWAALLQR